MALSRLPRPHMPLGVKLVACLLVMGLDPDDVDFDHQPALGLRHFDPATGKYSPDANDPRYIVPRLRADHKIKTNGRGATTRGSDKGEIAKTRRLEKRRAALLAKPTRKERRQSRWAKGPKLRSRNTLRKENRRG